jgi:hypothetical protein
MYNSAQPRRLQSADGGVDMTAKIRLSRMVAALVALGLPAACAPAITPQLAVPSAHQLNAKPSTSNVGWLYVAEDEFSVGIVYIFGYPDPNRVKVKAIEGVGYVYGPCVDAKGNVWVPAAENRRARVVEFPPGKTKAIAGLDIPKGDGVGECAVDPVTGNLAVLGSQSVNIFTKAKSNATNYGIGNVFIEGCAYDDKGNLFVDAMRRIGSSLTAFTLYELPKGSKTFTSITLDKRTGFAGGLEWDGEYLALVTGGNGVRPVLYRFTVSGSKGTVVQSVHFNGLSYIAWFATGDSRMVGTSGVNGSRIRYWPYPGGGAWTSELPSRNVEGMAITPVY